MIPINIIFIFPKIHSLIDKIFVGMNKINDHSILFFINSKVKNISLKKPYIYS